MIASKLAPTIEALHSLDYFLVPAVPVVIHSLKGQQSMRYHAERGNESEACVGWAGRSELARDQVLMYMGE